MRTEQALIITTIALSVVCQSAGAQAIIATQPPLIADAYSQPVTVPTVQPHGQPLPPGYSIAEQTQVNIPWHQKLANKRHHDFGIVPTASKQTHIFEFENTSGADLVLTNARASCGCTKPSVLTTIVQPGGKAQVEAVLDTLKFHGDRGATVTVSVKKMGQYVESAELQFSVKGRIRRDVVLHPGDVRFDTLLQGKPSETKVAISYAGAPNWEIVEVKSTNPNIRGLAKEVSRDPQARTANYELVVSLTGGQPVGSFNDYLTIVTNDQKTNGMPVHVHGRVSSGIQVAPIRLGTLPQGKSVSKRFIVKSDSPVEITAIECSDPRVRVLPPSGQRSAHVIAYELDTTESCDIDTPIKLHTNRTDQPTVEVPFQVTVAQSTSD